VQKEDEDRPREPQIICSMGLRAVESGTGASPVSLEKGEHDADQP
jgi:hypothetical protein